MNRFFTRFRMTPDPTFQRHTCRSEDRHIILRRPLGRRRISLLKPQPADGKEIPVRNMHPRQRDENRCQERMRTVIVNDLAAFDDAEGGTGLRRSPPSGMSITERDGIRASGARESLPLGGREAQIAAQGMIGLRIGRRRFCITARGPVPGRNDCNCLMPVAREERQEK